jgi:type VI secretion system protein
MVDKRKKKWFFLIFFDKKFFLFLMPLFLCSCASDVVMSSVKSVFGFKPANVWLEKVHFKAADNVNDNSPVTVHLLIPYSADLMKELLKMDADAYFKKADQIKIDNAGCLDVFSWDIIRGQRLNDVAITPSKLSGEGVVIFARYSSPGPHRATVADDREVVISLERSDFKVIPVKQ